MGPLRQVPETARSAPARLPLIRVIRVDTDQLRPPIESRASAHNTWLAVGDGSALGRAWSSGASNRVTPVLINIHRDRYRQREAGLALVGVDLVVLERGRPIWG